MNFPVFLCLSIFLFVGAQPHCTHKKTDTRNDTLELNLLRGDLKLCSGKEFGEVSFAIGCKYRVRETFDLAISLLHSFEYEEAEKAFAQVIDADPECAMAYWGVAMSLYHALWAPPGPEILKKGEHILAVASTLPQSEREQDYLNAIGKYYTNWETVDEETRANTMAQAMENLYLKYQEDPEAAIFYALALNAISSPGDTTYANQRKAGQILESLLTDNPNHPGIAHYIIHTYDNPALASNALQTARTYAEIAPSSAHAQHMPSHIFTRLGLWNESITSNLNSRSSAVCYAENSAFNAHWDEELHGLDYLVYAYLQQGNTKGAESINSYVQSMEKVYPENFKAAYALAAIPSRIALEIKDWRSATNLELPLLEFPWSAYPWQSAIVHFTRSLGASHLGDTIQARNEIHQLHVLHENLLQGNHAYQATQVEIQYNAAMAWYQLARGDTTGAVHQMTLAADLEDRTSKHPVTPGEVIPARELLGDMLLHIGKAKEALAAYRSDLRTHPNRFNALYGAAIATQRMQDTASTRQYFTMLLELPGDEAGNRPELDEAEHYITNL